MAGWLFAATLRPRRNLILRRLVRPIAAVLALVPGLAPGTLPAQEEERALRFTVRPSGLEGDESLDQKLARRDRFRFICIGCVRVPGQVDGSTFRPIETLNAPQLTRALAQPSEPPADGPPAPE